MSIKSIKARTEGRNAAGIIPVYQHRTPISVSVPVHVPLPVLTPCTHGGTDADIIERCPSCNGGGKHVRECEIHGRCTHDVVNPAVMDCGRCRREGLGYQPLGSPIRPGPRHIISIAPARLAPITDGRRFNCSLVEHGGRRLLAYRAGWTGSRIHIAELGADLQPIRTTPVELAHPRCAMAQEDPRLFVHAGVLHLAFAGVQWERGKILAHQMLGVLDTDLRAERIWEPRYPQRTYPMEKNWQFFEHANELYAVYGIAPQHTILRCNVQAGTAEVAYQTPTASRWSGGVLRGGAPPVRVGDEFYHWFHGWERSKRPGTPHGDWYEYSVGVYTFEARPPFAVKRMTPRPLWLADPRKLTLNVTHDKAVIYPSGAIVIGDRWLVSAGHQDAECLIGEFLIADVEKALESVA